MRKHVFFSFKNRLTDNKKHRVPVSSPSDCHCRWLLCFCFQLADGTRVRPYVEAGDKVRLIDMDYDKLKELQTTRCGWKEETAKVSRYWKMLFGGFDFASLGRPRSAPGSIDSFDVIPWLIRVNKCPACGVVHLGWPEVHDVTTRGRVWSFD